MDVLVRFFSTVGVVIALLGSPGCKNDYSDPITPPPGVRKLSFAGYTWNVKSSDILVGPGPNYFSDSSENVWIDDTGQLHLRITRRDGRWSCAEVISEKTFGYGAYRFYVASRIDQLNENAVLGLFTWDDASAYQHREIDIEFSRWGQSANDNAQFVVQPWDNPDNIRRFYIQLSGDYSTHSFEWKNDHVLFQSVHGHYEIPPLSHSIASWEYTDQYVPPPGNENARINLWLFQGLAPSDQQDVEVVIKNFEFIP